MKVSVIVSTYSVERFSDVIRCLNSIEEQTLKPHEVLLVLDPYVLPLCKIIDVYFWQFHWQRYNFLYLNSPISQFSGQSI
jgi:hypothetical protein